jgi:oxygen-independent coproporphyrinogen-3 oxidase
MVAVGVSGIGDLRGALVQNVKTLTGYYEAIEAGRFPIERGYVLDRDDRIRRYVITELMCRLRLDLPEVSRRYGIDARQYFAQELTELAGDDSPSADGLVTIDDESIEVTEEGRQFVRNVCMIFDRHYRERAASSTPVFSRTV